MTFDAYGRARRLGRSLKSLREGEDLAAAALDAGYESESGFREAFGKHFGRPPGAARDAECALAAWLRTPLGPMIAAATSRGVCLLEFTDRRMLETQLEILGRRLAPAARARRQRGARAAEGRARGVLRREAARVRSAART